MKYCIACEHLWIDLGQPDWSSWTPGEPGSIQCFKGHYELGGPSVTTSVVYTAMLKAETCVDFKQRAEVVP